MAILAIAVLVGLGVWQLHRRTWKLNLIAQVEHRLAAAPVAAPGPAQWPAIGKDDAYTRVAARGHFIAGHDVPVQAVTDLGGGYWILTPLTTGAGWTVLVNRGFVPQAQRTTPPPPPAGEVTVRGLLRVTEPGGAFLRSNAPAQGRWYSRDVTAMAMAQRLRGPVAPYFIDEDAHGGGWPRGGLTVVSFPNNHLVYALTWFGMAALLVVLLFRSRRADG